MQRKVHPYQQLKAGETPAIILVLPASCSCLCTEQRSHSRLGLLPLHMHDGSGGGAGCDVWLAFLERMQGMAWQKASYSRSLNVHMET